MVTATEQLVSDSPQKRIAGVYALAEISDTYRGEYKQRVVDILCGYLRTDRHGEHTQKFIERLEPGQSDEKPAGACHARLISPDAVVESTIFRVMRERLLRNRISVNEDLANTDKNLDNIQVKNTDQLWCDCAFDLQGAVLVENLNLSQVSFDSNVNFDDVYFPSRSNFSHSVFSGTVSFLRARFDVAKFERASFDEVSFRKQPSLAYIIFVNGGSSGNT
ncbi:hypothetical protein JTE88_05070 [Arcanobacterium phocisimile]|uniref:Pentapeptide repeat-containing protein n=1 Tax=Arcanobacterium phocisimile TaxID=1302235 RepID=A0ABX7IEV0_9ACTO|nr:hypothetical protein [Arcanobacterium phocisimile]QRV01487.1 hypothetical protein JTE88_05070 [Arcanobacterium phocisimile]